MRTTLTRLTLAAAAALLPLAALASTASAVEPVPTSLASLCEADAGVSFVDRFGSWRCQGAAVDGMGVFWAERQLCERAQGRRFLEAVTDPDSGVGAWICTPTG